MIPITKPAPAVITKAVDGFPSTAKPLQEPATAVGKSSEVSKALSVNTKTTSGADGAQAVKQDASKLASKLAALDAFTIKPDDVSQGTTTVPTVRVIRRMKPSSAVDSTPKYLFTSCLALRTALLPIMSARSSRFCNASVQEIHLVASSA